MSKIFISVDVEASGPIAGTYSMLSIGACVVDRPDLTFYRELKPINDNFDPEALAVSGLNFERLKREGTEPVRAMEDFNEWVRNVGKKQAKMLAAPASFDWQFVNWYFVTYVGKNPFGIGCTDLRSVLFGLMPRIDGITIRKQDIKSMLGVTEKHTHNALDDAIEQAAIFSRMLEIREGKIEESNPTD